MNHARLKDTLVILKSTKITRFYNDSSSDFTDFKNILVLSYESQGSAKEQFQISKIKLLPSTTMLFQSRRV